MSLIPLLEWILDSNWFQKVVQFKVFPSNGEIINFGHLQLISSTELGGVEGWGENVKLFSTSDCFKHLSTRAINWKEIPSLLRIFSYSTSYSFGSKRFRSSSSINFTFLILSSWLHFNPDKRSTKLTSRLSKFCVISFNSFSTFSRLLKNYISLSSHNRDLFTLFWLTMRKVNKAGEKTNSSDNFCVETCYEKTNSSDNFCVETFRVFCFRVILVKLFFFELIVHETGKLILFKNRF